MHHYITILVIWHAIPLSAVSVSSKMPCYDMFHHLEMKLPSLMYPQEEHLLKQLGEGDREPLLLHLDLLVTKEMNKSPPH